MMMRRNRHAFFLLLGVICFGSVVTTWWHIQGTAWDLGGVTSTSSSRAVNAALDIRVGSGVLNDNNGGWDRDNEDGDKESGTPDLPSSASPKSSIPNSPNNNNNNRASILSTDSPSSSSQPKSFNDKTTTRAQVEENTRISLEGFQAFFNLSHKSISPGVAKFQRFLYNRQFHSPNCSKMYSLRQHTYGLFSQVQGAAHSLIEAMAHGYVFTWENASTRYASASRCPKQNYECFFLPVTSCKLTPSSPYIRRTSCVFDRARTDTRNAPDMWDNKRRIDVVIKLKQLVGLEGDEFGPHFFIREALRFIMRPNPAMLGLLRILNQEDLKPLDRWIPLGSCATCRIGAHIRRGDKSKDWAVPPLESYMEQIRMRSYVESSAGVDQVVLSSDDSVIYSQVQVGVFLLNSIAFFWRMTPVLLTLSPLRLR